MVGAAGTAGFIIAGVVSDVVDVIVVFDDVFDTLDDDILLDVDMVDDCVGGNANMSSVQYSRP